MLYITFQAFVVLFTSVVSQLFTAMDLVIFIDAPKVTLLDMLIALTVFDFIYEWIMDLAGSSDIEMGGSNK